MKLTVCLTWGRLSLDPAGCADCGLVMGDDLAIVAGLEMFVSLEAFDGLEMLDGLEVLGVKVVPVPPIRCLRTFLLRDVERKI